MSKIERAVILVATTVFIIGLLWATTDAINVIDEHREWCQEAGGVQLRSRQFRVCIDADAIIKNKSL